MLKKTYHKYGLYLSIDTKMAKFNARFARDSNPSPPFLMDRQLMWCCFISNVPTAARQMQEEELDALDAIFAEVYVWSSFGLRTKFHEL